MKRILIDNFEDVLRWVSVESQATAMVEISDVNTFRGGGCLHIMNVKEALTDGGGIEQSFLAMLTGERRFKLSGEMKFGTKTNLESLIMKLDITIEGYIYYVGVKYDVINNEFYYRSASGTWTKVFDSEVTILADTWFTFFIECDIKDARMRKVGLAGREQEINTRLTGNVTGTKNRTCRIAIECIQEGTTAGFEVWVDNVRLEGE